MSVSHLGLQAQVWTSAQKDTLHANCMREAATKLIPGAAKDYCDCYLQTFLQRFPDRTKTIADSSMTAIASRCMDEVKYRYPGGPFIERWTEASKTSFLNSCKRKLASNTKINAAIYCPCMLEKIMVLQPDPRLANSIDQLVLDQLATECLGKKASK